MRIEDYLAGEDYTLIDDSDYSYDEYMTFKDIVQPMESEEYDGMQWYFLKQNLIEDELTLCHNFI